MFIPALRDLRPDLVVDSFVEIDFQRVGRPYLILDVDNTIARCEPSADLAPGVLDHIWNALNSGALRDLCLVSNVFAGNAKARRVKRFAGVLKAHYVTARFLRLKPNPAPFREALCLMGAIPAQTVVVGDQLFTDVLGGKRLNMLTVYVRPLGPDHWTTRLTMRRVLERHLLRAWPDSESP